MRVNLVHRRFRIRTVASLARFSQCRRSFDSGMGRSRFRRMAGEACSGDRLHLREVIARRCLSQQAVGQREIIGPRYVAAYAGP